MDWVNGSSITVTVPVCGGELGAQFWGETYCLLVNLCPLFTPINIIVAGY